MVNKLHKSFSVLLVLLQLIAPLVHAHSEAKYAPAGIHLPGLEYVQADHQTSTIKANALLCVSEGVIVGIGSGLKQKAMPPFDLVSPYSETTIKYFDANPNRFEVGFSPHINAILTSQLFDPSRSSRSPPI